MNWMELHTFFNIEVDVAANESYVHVAWIDYDSYNGGYDIIYQIQ